MLTLGESREEQNAKRNKKGNKNMTHFSSQIKFSRDSSTWQSHHMTKNDTSIDFSFLLPSFEMRSYISYFVKWPAPDLK